MLIKLEGFCWQAELIKDGQVIDEWCQHNLIPNEGISHLMRAPFGDVMTINRFYCGLFKGNYTPTSATKAADIPTIGEYIGYKEENRPVWDRVFSSTNNTYSNTDNKAIFTFTEDQTLNGFFLVSSDIKGTGNGTLLSIVRFPTPKAITQGVELKLTASLAYLSGSTL